MFKLPNLPSPRAELRELADFSELLCWLNGQTSTQEIIDYLGRVGENNHNEGCEDDDDKNAEVLDEVMNEIDRRKEACNGGYPFKLDMTGTVLRLDEDIFKNEPVRRIVYLYLLLSTRLNMKDDRIHGGIDGADIFEGLSAHVLKSYLGADRAQAFVFGTSKGFNFESQVNKLCEKLGEGIGFESADKAPTKAKDGKLDVVAWVAFADQLSGQLIIFAQCKTGTTWQGLTSQLQPINFCKKWIRQSLVVDPVRAFCVAEAVDRARWNSTVIDAGIFFDRCRIVDFVNDLDDAILKLMRSWTRAAFKTINLKKAAKPA